MRPNLGYSLGSDQGAAEGNSGHEYGLVTQIALLPDKLDGTQITPSAGTPSVIHQVKIRLGVNSSSVTSSNSPKGQYAFIQNGDSPCSHVRGTIQQAGPEEKR